MWFKRLEDLLSTPKANQTTPRTFDVESKTTASVRPSVFDPALCHFSNGMRRGEPQFKDPEAASDYLMARYRMLQFILERMMNSDAAKHLVLRGSTVMRAWFPDEARHPGDLDWVVTPQTLTMESPYARGLIEKIINALRGEFISESLKIRDEAFVTESIWTYDRAPGVRILVPWSCTPEPLSTIQMDFVFQEDLAYPPESASLALHQCEPVEVTVAGREQSLAWKLLWLATDCHPMGKDLYDATLLAESTPLKPEGLLRTLQSVPPTYGFDILRWFTSENFLDLEVDWDSFVKEYPDVRGTSDEWKNRLVSNIRAVLEQLSQA